MTPCVVENREGERRRGKANSEVCTDDFDYVASSSVLLTGHVLLCQVRSLGAFQILPNFTFPRIIPISTENGHCGKYK